MGERFVIIRQQAPRDILAWDATDRCNMHMWWWNIWCMGIFVAVLMHSDYNSAFLKLSWGILCFEACLYCIPILSTGMLMPAQRPHMLSSIWYAMPMTSLFTVFYSKMEFTYYLIYREPDVFMHFSYYIHMYNMTFKFPQSLHWNVGSGTCNSSVNRHVFTSAKIMCTCAVSQIIASLLLAKRCVTHVAISMCQCLVPA